jgi:protein-tyrosine-phosphatase
MMKDVQKILFVCTGNSCRSIMAEAYMKKRAQEESLSLEVKSAGTLGINDMPPTQQALKVLADEGIDTEGYQSKALSKELIDWADLILVMEPLHKSRILEDVPEAEGKVRYLAEFNPEKNDVMIPDPIGRPVAFYKTSFGLIRYSIEELIKWLKK